ncbi:unnamed protein product [Protopolystoma xenopodis]|uniref:Laminin N-terminal domain-containing protein n=1 Tax=Protopolystoma xenopodis TaxID=117903 RepID=A0A3S5AAK2_9PLAT|nr:unnamed protein product [Protopolystoma xenopodis]
MPAFTNIIRSAPVQATSTCGETAAGPVELCGVDGVCRLCDPARPDGRHSADRLTDATSPDRPTCWASDRVSPGRPETGGLWASAVNLTISLGKRFEVFYISLQPCSSAGALPDAIAIFKSSDHGAVWTAWQYFSHDCRRAFGMPTTSEHNTHITPENLQEVLCVALKPPPAIAWPARALRRRHLFQPRLRHTRASPANQTTGPRGLDDYLLTPASALAGEAGDWVAAFSTTIGRPSVQPWSPALVDWMTMTDLKISLIRFPRVREPQARHLRSPTESPGDQIDRSRRPSRRVAADSRRLLPGPAGPAGPTDDNERLPSSRADKQLLPGSLDDENASVVRAVTGPASEGRRLKRPEQIARLYADEYFAFSDIAVGGRCKCNGHSNRCIRDVESGGNLACACEHNTEGVDCERCRPGYVDRPWARATLRDANVCVRKFGPRPARSAVHHLTSMANSPLLLELYSHNFVYDDERYSSMPMSKITRIGPTAPTDCQLVGLKTSHL